MPQQDRPNILFIMTDQQSADLMSCAGNEYLNTPAMDSLAEQGVRFTRAYTPNPLCVPARCSIFTGQNPHTTGIQRNCKDPLDIEAYPLMGTHFKNAGYDTGYFGKWHINAEMDAENSGFNEFGAMWNRGHDDEIAEPAIEFITRSRDKPFLAVASFSNPHDVCQLARREPLPSGEVGEPPAPKDCPPAPGNLEPSADETDTMTYARLSYHAAKAFPVGDFTPDDWRQFRWSYNRLVEKVDAEIGKVLDALRTAGLEDNTLVIFTSDHGDCAGAHRFNQKTVFYEESTRVPLIISYAGKTQASTSDLLVNIGIDILPTILAFAGIALPSNLRGASLKPILLGESSADWRRFVVVADHIVQGEPAERFEINPQGRMVRSDSFKYCVYDHGQHRESLFDLVSDLGEMVNLARDPAYRKTLQEHREMLRQHGKSTGDDLVTQLLADDVTPIPFNN